MWWSTVLKGVDKESELSLSLLRGKSEALEDSLLQLCIVDTDTTATKLSAVTYKVVCVSSYATRVRFGSDTKTGGWDILEVFPIRQFD